LQPQLDSLLKVAVRWDIRFYTLDSRGLYTHSAVPGSGQDASSRGVPLAATQAAMITAWSNGDAMTGLARETGGQFFENSNNLLKGIRTAFADGREEYVLAYVPTNKDMDGQFRKISVELKDKKLHVAAKAGYWSLP
jgi:VWFA-related protein